MKLYKLTDEKGQTRGGMQWGEDVTHAASGDESQDLCSDGWIHAYTSPLLAVLLNPLHADFKSPQLWECEGEIRKDDLGLKCGCRSLMSVKQIPLPEVSDVQRIAFGILCAKEVCTNASWNVWADAWLSGKDRSAAATEAAAWAADKDNKSFSLIEIAERAMEVR